MENIGFNIWTLPFLKKGYNCIWLKWKTVKHQYNKAFSEETPGSYEPYKQL